MYQPNRPPRSERVAIRGLSYHLLRWGGGERSADRAPLVLVHGWMDVAASYQFMVDAFSEAFVQQRAIIAPDWRGFGGTRRQAANDAPAGTGPREVDNYWFPDYLADLDFLLDQVAPDRPIDLVGHSLGGNVAMHYAGVRPERIRRLVNLEGFGMPAARAEQASGRYARWIDELKQLHRGELELKPYADANGVARRLMKTNPRLAQDKADWLALHWAAADAQGRWRILGDAAHKIVNAQLSRVDEVLALYARIAAPVLMVRAEEDSLAGWWGERYTQAEFEQRLGAVPRLEQRVIENAGHMLHHDQPQALAALIESFLAA
ncbi:MAG: Hydrolase, alpha/beta fold family [Burkholderiaceae bacterium]|jgi:pimeloyl-ACP methyl ester carboxylesterase|nr:MAG: Hydrolase, alpha/beta fold family [Burkholderiaceae bacterium]